MQSRQSCRLPPFPGYSGSRFWRSYQPASARVRHAEIVDIRPSVPWRVHQERLRRFGHGAEAFAGQVGASETQSGAQDEPGFVTIVGEFAAVLVDSLVQADAQ